MTQPNINSSSGKSFTNYRNKIMNRYVKGFDEYRKSDYFKEKAVTAGGYNIQCWHYRVLVNTVK
mgnify:CR=1 FL=1